MRCRGCARRPTPGAFDAGSDQVVLISVPGGRFSLALRREGAVGCPSGESDSYLPAGSAQLDGDIFRAVAVADGSGGPTVRRVDLALRRDTTPRAVRPAFRRRQDTTPSADLRRVRLRARTEWRTAFGRALGPVQRGRRGTGGKD